MLVPEMPLPSSAPVFEAALEGLVRVNLVIMRAAQKAGRPIPPLYGGGIRYAGMLGEVWRHCDSVARSGWGNCHDLAGYKVAEDRFHNRDAKARVVVRRTGARTWHAVEEHGDGTIEDPSEKLGMNTLRGRSELHDPRLLIPREECVMYRCGPPQLAGAGAGRMEFTGSEVGADFIGADPSPQSAELTWTVERLTNGWRGTVRVPLVVGGHALFIRRDHTTEAGAKGAAASAAGRTFLKLPPQVKELLPPEAKFALNIINSSEARNIAKDILKIF